MTCRSTRVRHRLRGMAAIAIACAATVPAPASAADQVDITNLSDIVFGTISNLAVDQTIAQTVCAYSTVLLGHYSVAVTGSGAGGAFTLAAGSATLPYEVQWSAASGAMSGTPMTPGTTLTGLASGALAPGCLAGLTSSGSLIVILRSAKLTAATAGNYSGTLTILLSPN